MEIYILIRPDSSYLMQIIEHFGVWHKAEKTVHEECLSHNCKFVVSAVSHTRLQALTQEERTLINKDGCCGDGGMRPIEGSTETRVNRDTGKCQSKKKSEKKVEKKKPKHQKREREREG